MDTLSPVAGKLFGMSFALAMNFALVISAMLLYTLLLDGRFSAAAKRYQVIIGISFGLFAIISMQVPIHVRDGIIIDAKYPLVGIATCFGGPLAGFIAASFSAASRIFIGGIGVYAAIPTLYMVWGLGILFRKDLSFGLQFKSRILRYLGFGVLIWLLQFIGGMVFFVFLPADEVGPLLVDRSLPALVIYPPMTVLLGLALEFVESRYQLRRSQAESQMRFSKVFESSPLPMAVIKYPDLLVRQSNKVFAESFGKRFLEMQALLIHRAWMTLQGRGDVEFREECQFHKERVIRYITFLGGVVEFDGEPHLLIHLVDRTKDVIAEQTRQKLLESLERKNREIQDLNFALHHDLRTPLVSIQSFLGELRDRLQEGDVAGGLDDLKRVEHASQRLSKLIFGISQLNETFNVSSEVVESSLPLIVSKVCQKIGLPANSIVYELDIELVNYDERMLTNLFQPILENALQFARPDEPLQVVISQKLEQDLLKIRFRDNGIGIEPIYLERIFNLFEKLNPRTPGIGLGLTLTRRIVNSMGGKVWMESKGLGHGATVCVNLPAKEAIFA